MHIETLNAELNFQFARSSGSGGQHVNKVSTKVELRFDLVHSKGLDEAEKAIIHKKLINRISKEGILQLTCQQSRSQQRNKKQSIELFFDLLTQALRPCKVRKATQLSAKQKAQRLRAKRFQSQKKKARRKVNSQSDAGLFSD